MSTRAALDLALDDLSAGRAPEPEAGRRVAELARAHLRTDAGQAMQKRLAVQQRDQLLVGLAAQHFAGLSSVRATARVILTAAGRYQASGWLRDRQAVTCPRPPESVEGMFWAALKAWPDLPSDTVIRNLLANTTP